MVDGMKKIILFELNEVPLKIVEYFQAKVPSSNLATYRSKLTMWETMAADEGHLSPWKTWPTLHRGTASHGLHDFGQPTHEIDQHCPPIWKILASRGISTGVFGSLHTHPLPSPLEGYSFYVPDVFAPDADCFPAYISAFQALSLTMSRSSGRNVSRNIPIKEALSCVLELPRLRIRIGTFGGLARQLFEEQFQRWKTARRRTWQSVIAFDVYLELLRQRRPAFTSFFTNHVASAMHRYWAAAFPGDYATPPFSSEWIATYHKEVLFAMKKADKMIGHLIRLVQDDPSYKLMIVSSMGQQSVATEPIERQVWIADPDKFFARLGINRQEWERRPAMFAQFNIVISEGARTRLLTALDAVEIAGQRLSYRSDGFFFSLDFGHPNLDTISVRLGGTEVRSQDIGLINLEIEDRSGSSAYHVPEGSLLIYDPDEVGRGYVGQISTLAIAPAIMENFGLSVPEYMRLNSQFRLNASGRAAARGG